MNKKLLVIPTLILAVAVASHASATDLGIGANMNVGMHEGSANAKVRADVNTSNGQSDAMHPGIVGTVTAVSGDTITVQTKAFTKGSVTSPAATYTVNAQGAAVTKANAVSSPSAITVGDTIMVQGTVSGTTVTATKINDGIMAKGQTENKNKNSTTTTIPNGNGQPIIGGKVTAVSGNTVTITNSSNVSYIVDVTNAKVTKNGTSSAASTIAVGDTILAQGTINGTSVTAVNVVDSATTTTTTTNGKTEVRAGFFGSIGNFFSKLFGF